jgi:glyoxylase-like metal-dependent hydrolase (beta-lactamase superfamily II)
MILRNLQIPTRVLLLATACFAMAGEKEDALIAQVTQAYGGEALANLSSYIVDVRFLAPATGQSRTPDLVHLGSTNQFLTVDLNANKASMENVFFGRGGTFLNGTITNGEQASAINYQTMSYGEAPSADIYTIAGGTMRTTDSLLAYELNKAGDKAEYLGAVDYMNRPHETIKMPFPQSPDLTLYVDSETHLISRMIRTNPQLGQLDYVFSDYKEHNGIAYAASINFLLAGDFNLISTRHVLQFNTPIDSSLFELPAGMKQEAERIDTSEMLANKISDSVFHVGQNAGFSIFIDTGDSIVAAGGYPGLKDRFDRFKKESGIHKPLAYQIVTHHHTDHLGGLGEALDLGATLVTVENNEGAIRDATAIDIPDGQFLRMENRLTLGSGRQRVEIYEVSTIHAESFLVTYVPAQKLIFIADHLNSPYKTGTPTANLNTVTIYDALQNLGIDIKRILIAHGAREFDWKDIREAVSQYSEQECPETRAVCAAI